MQRKPKSKVWSALLAGAGGGGFALWACMPVGSPSTQGLAPEPGRSLPADSVPAPQPERPRRDRWEGVAISDSGRVVVPGELNAAWWNRPPQLSLARGWAQSNESLYQVVGQATKERQLQSIGRAYAEATEPVVRQNLIFLVALTQPWESAEPWLRLRLLEGGADALDARWALAMSGCQEALGDVEFAPPVATPRPVLVDSFQEAEVLGLQGGEASRARLLAYRALEVVDRSPYFKKLALEVHLRWVAHPLAGEGEGCDLTWINPNRTAPRKVAGRLWAAWVRAFPGHPGNDDVALRLGSLSLRERRYLDAARWFSRASVLPDQDVTWGALNKLLATSEVLLGEAALDDLVADAELSGRNRDLLEYVRMRRLAARRGCAAGLEEAARLAHARPARVVAQAWARRWTVAPPEGLASGQAELSREDPLLRRERALPKVLPRKGVQARSVPAGAHLAGQERALGRLDPHPEAVSLDVERLARQFRLWETLAALEAREASAQTPGEAADFRYKQAAIFFYQPYALFPVYTQTRRVTETVVDRLWDLDAADQERFEVGVATFAEAAQGWCRAGTLLAGFEIRYPDYVGLDEALFTRSLAYERLLRAGWCRDRRGVVQSLVKALETLVETCPESHLSDDARRAVAYWRANYGDCFR